MDWDQDFADYVTGRWAALVRSAVLMGCSQPDAEDLVQTALARCYRAWPSVRRADNRDAYIYRVLVNCRADSRRRRWWGERPSATDPEVVEHQNAVAQVDLVDAVERALGDLSRPHRDVIVLRFYAHLTERETAQALGISLGTVKSRASRALTALSRNDHLSDLADGSTT